MNARIISLLTSDVKRSQKLIGVSKETIEENLKSLNIASKVLARMSNAIWDILLATEQKANPNWLGVCPGNSSGMTIDAVYGHPVNKNYSSWGARRHLSRSHRRSLLEVWTSGRSIFYNQQIRDHHWRHDAAGDTNQTSIWGNTQYFIMPGKANACGS